MGKLAANITQKLLYPHGMSRISKIVAPPDCYSLPSRRSCFSLSLFRWHRKHEFKISSTYYLCLRGARESKNAPKWMKFGSLFACQITVFKASFNSTMNSTTNAISHLLICFWLD
jgi:hypothetical protein